MKKTKNELELIKNFIDGAYNSFGNSLKVKTNNPYGPNNQELGYCYRYSNIDRNSGMTTTIYKIVCSPIGREYTDFRILMHEYGHIYLAHLDGIHEELDYRIWDVFKNYRNELIDQINSRLGIDYAQKLVERVIDDKVLNHSLHNIAMDMEVNSKVLSEEDIDEIEKDLSEVILEQSGGIEKMTEGLSEEEKKKVEEKFRSESLIKLIIPSRYHTSDGQPFPAGLSYVEYLIMIIKNLDQFVKMMVSIKLGGNGDTSGVSEEQLQGVLNPDSKEGGGEMSTLDDLMESMGMSDSSSDKDQSSGDDGSGSGNDKDSGEGQGHKDHDSESREKADKNRESGEVKSSKSRVTSGTANRLVLMETEQDQVDNAIDEVIKDFKARVVRRKLDKDTAWYWNRGINRSVLAPAYRPKISFQFDPKIVYLIDVSGSMATSLIQRILKTISSKMKKLGTGRGLKYDIITWSTCLGEHIKDIDPKKKVPSLQCGGGTTLATGIEYFKKNYQNDSILVVISDFEDELRNWEEQLVKMKDYSTYGFNYGSSWGYGGYGNLAELRSIKVRNFEKW